MKITSLNKPLKIKTFHKQDNAQGAYFEAMKAKLKAQHGIDIVRDLILAQPTKIVCFADVSNRDDITLEVVSGNWSMLGFEDKPTLSFAALLACFDHDNGYAKVAGKKQYHKGVIEQLFDFDNEPNVTFPIINEAGKHWIRLNLVIIRDQPALAAVFITDVTNFLVEEEELFIKTHHDSLTSLFNKYTLDYHYGLRYQHDDFHVMFCDLDDFKVLNDALGHQEGNRYLKQFAEILREHEQDLSRFYRIGGDEFIGLLFDKTERIKQIAEAIVRQTTELSMKAFNTDTSVSIGVVKADKRDDVIAKADTLLYRAKAEGKNRWLFTTESDLKETKNTS